jgi:hypothetical protein
MEGRIALSGNVGIKIVRAHPENLESIWQRIKSGLPFGDLEKEIKIWRFNNLPNLYRGLRTVLLSQALGLPSIWGELYLMKIFGKSGRRLNYGLASLRVITTTGVGFIVDAFQNSVELEIMKYHALGTGTGNEAAGDTALGTELTTEYTGNVRATGSTEEGATGNIYKSIGTNTLDSGTPAITEHGILSQAATGGGVLLDRSKFSAVNLDGTQGDSLQSTYQGTFTAGS